VHVQRRERCEHAEDERQRSGARSECDSIADAFHRCFLFCADAQYANADDSGTDLWIS